MMSPSDALGAFPRALSSYPDPSGQSIVDTLRQRVEIEPFNLIATGIFLLAIVHTFAAARFTDVSHRIQHRHDERARAEGRRRPRASPPS